MTMSKSAAFRNGPSNPSRRWKLSPIDLEGRNRWVEYSKAKDAMIEHTDIPECRWRQINSNDKRRLRLNIVRDMLDAIPYENVIPRPMKLPERPEQEAYTTRPPRDAHYIIPDYYSDM